MTIKTFQIIDNAINTFERIFQSNLIRLKYFSDSAVFVAADVRFFFSLFSQ